MKIKKPRDSQYRDEALADVTKEPMHRINIEIPKSAFKELKAKAAMQGTTITSLYKVWVFEYLKKSSNEDLSK